jgi:hypothetical protein
MTMSLQVEAVSSYQGASAALFPATMRAAQTVPVSRQREELPAPPKVDNRLEVPLAELTFRHLKSTDEIASIAHLRKEIQLVAAGVADPAFVAREKKETRRALSPPLSAAAPSSGRFASFR